MDDPTATPHAPPRFGAAEAVATAVSVLWLIGAAVVALGNGDADGPLWALGLVAGLVPVALVWVAVVLLRTARSLRAEAARLHATLDAVRQAGQAGRQSEPRPAPSPPLERRLDELMAAQARLEAALARAMQPAAAPGGSEARGFSEASA
ncbi:hypothetical protein CCR87_00475, partial [Rhodobaculum claviforme]|nr:hypothetical protein [Rhodobaculum claviforme]